MRDWESDHQGVEAPRPQAFTQKDTQLVIKLQMTPRDGAEHGEGEMGSQKKGGQRTQLVIKLQMTPRDGEEHREGDTGSQRKGGQRTQCYHLGPAGDWAFGQVQQGGGAGVCVVEVGRERKGPLDGRTLGPKGTLFRRSRMAKVGETDEVRQT